MAAAVSGATDVLTFVPVKAGYIAADVTASASGLTPKLDELTAS